MRNQNGLLDTLRELAYQYPADMIKDQILDIPRIAFNINIALNSAKKKSPDELELCDLGGGVGMFSVGCASHGLKRTVLVDDFNDPVNHRLGDSILGLHRKLGVEIISRNVVENGISDIAGSFDIITTFDSMEHWHHSPKKLFHEVSEKLKPGGVFVLGVPNSVNIRKRICIPFGMGKWSTMNDWYESEVFRGHVREPDVNDLKYIAADMGLTDIKIHGRNWLGYYSSRAVVRLATKIADHPLRLLPSLCSDIYMIGVKV